MSVKPKRTLGPAQFEAYMDFVDSLKDGSNNDAIDKFKYKMAVREGYIKPKLEAAGGLTADAIRKGIDGLLQAFLPYLDTDEQAVVGGVMEKFDEAIATGKNPASVLFGDDSDSDENECVCEDGKCGDAECVKVCDGDSCTTVCAKDDDGDDGEGKKSKPAPEKKEDSDDDGDDGKPNGKPPVEECGDGKKLQESVGEDGVDYDSLADQVLDGATP